MVQGKIVASGCLTLFSTVHILLPWSVLHFFSTVHIVPLVGLTLFSTVHIVGVTLTPSPLCFLHGMILAWGPVSYTFEFGIVSHTHGRLLAVSVACISSAHSGALGTVTCTLLHGLIVACSFSPLILYEHWQCGLYYIVFWALWLAPWCHQHTSYFSLWALWLVIHCTVLFKRLKEKVAVEERKENFHSSSLQ